MAERPRSGKPLNKNWCRCWQGVCIAQEVFADVTTDGFGGLQGEIIDAINTTKSFAQHTLCTSCKTPNLLPCRTKQFCKGPMRSCASHASPELVYTPCKTNGFCGEFVIKLKENHRFVSPVWKNTDASKWCTDAWEIAKCFMSPDGYADKANAKETDFNGLISSIMNCTYFQKYFSDDLSKAENIAEKAKKHVTKLRHNPDMEVTDDQTTSLLDAFINLLNDERYLRNNKKAKSAREHLEKLKSGSMDITENEISTITSYIRNVENHMRELRCSLEKFMIDVDKQRMHVKSQMSVATALDFKEDLGKLYMSQYSTLPVYPSLPEIDDKLHDIYVKPKVIQLDKGKYDRASFRGEHLRRSVELRQKDVTALRDIFCKETEQLQNIYIQGEPGVGKTSLCNALANLWSNPESHDANPGATQPLFDDVQSIKEFEFLFLVSLRDFSGRECNVEEMIWRQIVKCLPTKRTSYSKEMLEEVLGTSKCLVLLDGLDEWIHPTGNSENCLCKGTKTLPSTVHRENCTFVTTTRPWKMATVFIKESEIDRRLEILGVHNPNDLTGKVIKSLNKMKRESKTSDDFFTAVETRGLNNLLEIPIIHMHLLCLWHDGRTLEPSVCKIYSSMIDMLFGRANDKKPQPYQSHELSKDIQHFPASLEDEENVQENKSLAVSLARLANHVLQIREREFAVVFTKRQVQSNLSNSELAFVLDIGILTQRESLSSTKKVVTYSFLHKTFQEFFAALHLAVSNNPQIDSIFMMHGHKDKVHDISLLFKFACGLCTETSRRISECLMQKITIELEKELHHVGTETKLDLNRHFDEIRSLQSLVLEGLHECRNNGNIENQLVLTHVTSHEPKSGNCLWKDLVEMNKEHIVSLNICKSSSSGTEDVSLLQEIILGSNDTLKYVTFRNLHNSYDMKACGQIQYLHIENSIPHDSHSRIDINPGELISCMLDHVTAETEQSILPALSTARKLHTLQINGCRDSRLFFEALPEIRSLKQLKLCNTAVEKDLVISLPAHIEYLYFFRVTVSLETLTKLADICKHVPHSITIKLKDCSALLGKKFAKFKESIQACADEFKVIKDGFKYKFEDENEYHVFKFTTVRH
ncbi:uncharacterized protein LOC128241733 [Mya arenaria]|uniref:uncharacterized protein LOC128241733 n=1 Tax=Mya arenaria TaxID=6604 RepID=UPI0022DEF217|nr:uncharacterized protein LOC128241733 [Mya arenaria]XP_052814749.1 uncharacterized protein LOC128241733 [Mya arenaria]XP_052814750.1 uncharacterized protein LOC128241733 [Mya arenaria]